MQSGRVSVGIHLRPSTLLDFPETTDPLKVYTDIFICIFIPPLLLFAKTVYMQKFKIKNKTLRETHFVLIC